MDWRASLAGLVVGALVGITGMGGGSIMAPFLIVGLGVPPLQAVASGLAYSAVTTAVGGWAHLRLGTTQLRTVFRLAVGSVPAAVFTVLLFTHLLSADGVDHVVKRAVGLVLMILAIALLVRGRLGGRKPRARRRSLPDWALTLGGGVVGAATGLTSIGSGSLTTAFLSTGTDEEGHRIVGTVVVHTMILTFAAGLAHLAMGQVDAGLTLSLLAGSIPGVVLGSRVTLKVPEPILREALASILLILSILSYAPKPEYRAPAGAVSEAVAQPAPAAAPAAIEATPADGEDRSKEAPPS
jgi:uncharacterized membrane protein YfcA